MTECKRCGSINLDTEIMPEGYMHYSKTTCADCGCFIGWGKKPENEDKRTDNNKKWRGMWAELGRYKCGWCSITQEILKMECQWHCDHITPLSEGGKDEFKNTQMLCKFCHVDKHQKRRTIEAILNGIDSSLQEQTKNDIQELSYEEDRLPF